MAEKAPHTESHSELLGVCASQRGRKSAREKYECQNVDKYAYSIRVYRP